MHDDDELATRGVSPDDARDPRTASKDASVQWTVGDFEAEVRRLDPHLNGAQLKAAVILLAALQVGTTVKALTDLTAYPKKAVEPIVDRLRRNDVFTKDGRVRVGWFDAETGGAAFWLDVNIALGFIRRIAPLEAADAVARTGETVTG